ncbi:MAG TPA: NUDIX hydrolase [Coleofasciculaceae cyanobacterium]|jgi:8-oxo-dGTP pyrophosphatase MutT (NUDIX family)
MNQPAQGTFSPPPYIRVTALGLIKHKTRIFVFEAHNPEAQEVFYRALGGGVEFGETSEAALRREFLEEINAELTNVQYIGCLENLFVYNGKPGHELIQLYQCDFVDDRFYQADSFQACEVGNPFTALWVECDRFKSGELRLVPPDFFQFL